MKQNTTATSNTTTTHYNRVGLDNCILNQRILGNMTIGKNIAVTQCTIANHTWENNIRAIIHET